MGFSKLTAPQYPPRQWALVGYPGSGKSTFAAQLAGPILWVDADHRAGEVVKLAAGEVYNLSENPADHVDARRVAELLRLNMPGSGIRTIVIDSLTAIVSPLVTAAIMANDAGENKNRIAAFKDKALALRTLQDAITGWGVATLWVYHYRDAYNAQAKTARATSISAVELARLRRSLNMVLAVTEEAGRRAVRVEWARRGRSGLTLYDDSGAWRGMPEKIEAAVYDGLSEADQDQIEHATPARFTGPEDAIAWGHERGAFRDALHAQNAYSRLKAAAQPPTAAAMWDLWIEDVERRLAEARNGTPEGVAA